MSVAFGPLMRWRLDQVLTCLLGGAWFFATVQWLGFEPNNCRARSDAETYVRPTRDSAEAHVRPSGLVHGIGGGPRQRTRNRSGSTIGR